MNVAVLFRSPLLQYTNHGPAVQYQIINSQINGAIAAVNGKELWRLNIRNVKQEQMDALERSAETLPRARRRHSFRTACGAPLDRPLCRCRAIPEQDGSSSPATRPI